MSLTGAAPQTINESGALPQTPSIKIDPETRQPEDSMIRDAAHAFEVAKSFEIARRPENRTNTRVDEVYNGKPPFVQSELENSKQGWRNNWTTKPLATVIDRGIVPYVSMVNGMQHLTAAKLPEKLDPNAEKSEKFRQIFTETVRQWAAFPDLVEGIFTELSKIGYLIVARVDPMQWKPVIYRSDEGFVSEDSPRETQKCPIVVLRHAFRPDELYPLIKDEEAASDAGWNVENLIEAINDAEPKPRPTAEEERKREDELRDNVINPAYRVGAPIIDCWVVPYTEVDGKVSQYIVRKQDGLELFSGFQVFENMADTVTLHTFERGNGKFYGSRGVAKALVNVAIALDRIRCEFADAVKRSSMITLHANSGQKLDASLRILSPFALLDFEGQIVPEGFPCPSDEYKDLINMLMGLMEVIGGAYLPQQITDPSNQDSTATAAALTAQRENEIRSSNLARQQSQFYDLISGMQKAFCHKENILAAKELFKAREHGGGLYDRETVEFAVEAEEDDLSGLMEPERPCWTDKEAVEAIVKMMHEGLTAVDIFKLGRTRASDVMGDDPQTKAEKLGEVIKIYGNDSTANMRPIKKMHVAAISSPDIAETAYPDDPTLDSEAKGQMRLQNIEIGTMLSGQVVPVLPQDDHKSHFGAGKQTLNGIAQGFKSAKIIPPDQFITGLGHCLEHLQGHFQGRQQNGEDIKSPDMQADEQWLAEAMKIAEGLAQAAQAERGAFTKTGAGGTPELPTPSTGAAPTPAAPPPPPAGPQGEQPLPTAPDGRPVPSYEDGARSAQAIAALAKAGLRVGPDQEAAVMQQMGLPPGQLNAIPGSPAVPLAPAGGPDIPQATPPGPPGPGGAPINPAAITAPPPPARAIAPGAPSLPGVPPNPPAEPPAEPPAQ